MRRLVFSTLSLAATLALGGCTGFGTFLDHAFSVPGTNPNIPMTDSENVRRVLGQAPEPTPLQPEPGNVWPGPQGPEPTLEDIQNGDKQQRDTPQTTVPGAQPNYPAGRQPRPRGSDTPPGNVPGNPQSGTPSASVAPLRPAPSSAPGPGPQGQVVQTPNGPAVDAGGTNSYRQLTTPQGPGAIVVPNGNGTSTIINPNGSVQTIPTPR